MRYPIVTTLLVISVPHFLHATTWTVGTGLTYTMPSQVSTLVGNGDTVDIIAGTYPSDVARWQADDLVLRGVGGLAHLESNGMSWGDKAIWVIQGDRTTVEWIEFSECTVPDQNGAGIRQEGFDLIVRHCYFHDNENGILAGEVHPSTILIEHCEFDHNGYGDGFSHNLYIGNIDSLIFRYNYSHHAHVGHELKSRAWVNVIEYNRLSNEADGDASREVDLPNGGQAYLIGNVIQQGVLGQNSNLVGFGLEGLTNPALHELYAINNTLVNEKSVGSFFDMANSANLFKGYNNILAGGGTFTSGGWPSTVDTLANLLGSITSMQFTSPATYDYHITASSPAHQIGFPAGVSTSGVPLVALYEYVHPADGTLRCQHATLDAGAYEACATQVTDVPFPYGMRLFPSPATDKVQVIFAADVIPERVEIRDACGRLLRSSMLKGERGIMLDVRDLAPGGYVLRACGTDRSLSQPFVKY